jgi:hypothetical protein
LSEVEGRQSVASRVIAWHLRIGWVALRVFLCLGGVLEMLHGFKVGLYLDVDHSARRHMWTLAHTHGTLLALVNIAFALSLERSPRSTRC